MFLLNKFPYLFQKLDASKLKKKRKRDEEKTIQEVSLRKLEFDEFTVCWMFIQIYNLNCLTVES